jgi:hypothetical protein
MLVRTNLAFPDQPFGAGHRPWRLTNPQLAALALQWHGADLLGYVVCYLRLDRHQPRQVDPDLGTFGFTGVLVERPAEVDELLGRLAFEAARCRTHAAILAGHQLGGDLDRLLGRYRTQQRQLADLALLGRAWADRPDHPRGLAILYDTHDDHQPGQLDLVQLAAEHGIQATLSEPILPPSFTLPAAEEALLVGALRRALTIGLVAGCALRRLDWQQPIPIDQVIRRTAWDLFPHLRLDLDPTAASA